MRRPLPLRKTIVPDFLLPFVGLLLCVWILGREHRRDSAVREATHIRLLGSKAAATAPDQEAAIVLVFQPKDCQGITPLVLALSRQTVVPVVGAVATDSPLADPNLFSRKYGMHFPVIQVGLAPAAVLSSLLGFPTTPFMLLVDTAGTVVATARGATVDDLLVLLSPLTGSTKLWNLDDSS